MRQSKNKKNIFKEGLFAQGKNWNEHMKAGKERLEMKEELTKHCLLSFYG